jgi:Flp pilus assembly protein TadB
MARLQSRLEAAEMPISAREFLSTCLIAALVCAVAALLLGAPALAVAGVTIAPALIWQRFESQRDAFRQAYDESLAECVQLLREGFSAAGALEHALEHAARNGADPAAADLRDVHRAKLVGTPLGEAFAGVLGRRHNPYLRMVAEVLTLKSTEGGSAGDVLLGLETMVREQVALRREILAKQAQSRIESMIVSLAPFGFFLVMKVMPWMREYENGFYASPIGQLVLTLAVVFSGLSFFLARRIANRGLTLEIKEVA